MATTFASWLTNNISKADWWRSKALSQGVTDEGGVDVPLPAHTPIYALATGPLKGAGYFYHGGPYFSGQETGASSNAPGYGVVSQQVNVPGVGLEDLYYQHIDIAPGINLCESGNCSGQMIQAGTLIGWSKSQLAIFGTGTATSPGEAEIGLGANTSWGGIWGNPSDPGTWLSDPRQALINLSQGAGPVPLSSPFDTVSQQTSNCPWYCNLTPFAQWGPCAGCAQPGTNASAQALSQGITDVVTPGWWARVGVILLGGILILVGAMKFMK